jgi:hypothetical protein
VSTSTDPPEGDTKSVACPPSTSIKKTSMFLAAGSNGAKNRQMRVKYKRMVEIVS